MALAAAMLVPLSARAADIDNGNWGDGDEWAYYSADNAPAVEMRKQHPPDLAGRLHGLCP